MNSPHSPSNQLFSHPLDALPWFSRVPQTVARDLAYTLLLCTFITIVFSLITKLNVPSQSLSSLLRINGVFSFTIGCCIHGFSMLATRFLARFQPHASERQRMVLGMTGSFAGTVGGYWIAAQLLGFTEQRWLAWTIGISWVVALFSAIAVSQKHRAVHDLALERERGARIEAQRIVTGARLQLLQAQIEPHFLFNTLANLSSLIEVEPKQARKMLDELTLLLRSSLDSTRSATTSLRKELQVIEAYLSVIKVRMGERLQYEISTLDELLDLQVPSMLLQPIVENAVKHGIEPHVSGGIVRIEVNRDQACLNLAVLDNGVGFAPNSKDNVGLGAVRERLEVQFGAAAQLEIGRIPDWTRVTIRIPMPT